MALAHPRLMLALTVASLAGSIWLYRVIPKGFFPEQDTGRIMAFIQASPDSSFQSMEARLKAVQDLLKLDPDVVSVAGFTGGGGHGGSINTARLFVTLVPYASRTGPLSVTLTRLRGKLASLPGTPTYLLPAQELRVGGRMGNSLYQYTLLADNFDELMVWIPRLEAKMRSLPELVDVSADQQQNGLMTRVTIDRTTASRLGVSMEAVDDALYGAFGQSLVGVSYLDLNQYRVVLEVESRVWQGPKGLREIYVPGAGGVQVPLSSIASVSDNETPLSVNHQGQFPAATISFNLSPGTALSQASAAIEAARREIGVPDDLRGAFAGTAQAFQASPEKPAPAVARRPGHGLHRARHPV